MKFNLKKLAQERFTTEDLSLETGEKRTAKLITQRIEIERQKWKAKQKAQVLPPAAPLQNAEKKLETKTAEKPQPKVQPIREAKDLPKGEIAVKPKMQPNAPATNEAAQPNAPGSPNAPKPPRINPKDISEPVMDAGGKKAADAVNNKKGELSPWTRKESRILQIIARS